MSTCRADQEAVCSISRKAPVVEPLLGASRAASVDHLHGHRVAAHPGGRQVIWRQRVHVLPSTGLSANRMLAASEHPARHHGAGAQPASSTAEPQEEAAGALALAMRPLATLSRLPTGQRCPNVRMYCRTGMPCRSQSMHMGCSVCTSPVPRAYLQEALQLGQGGSRKLRSRRLQGRRQRHQRGPALLPCTQPHKLMSPLCRSIVAGHIRSKCLPEDFLVPDSTIAFSQSMLLQCHR